LPNDLRNHERFHRQEKPFACTWPDCGRSFTLKVSLVDHVRADHENRRFECEHCGKKFKGRTSFRMHVYDKHVEEKPFGEEATSFTTAYAA
jgi:DNA-directed RNA polymerase subunit RPC12/RpoP